MKMISPQSHRTFLGLLAISMIAAATACTDEARQAANASKALMVSKTAPTPSKKNTQAAPIATSTRKPLLFVDGSQSMGGFVNCLSSPTAFDQLLDRLTIDIGSSSIQRFGSNSENKAKVEEFPASREMHCPAFYAATENPDYLLYQRFAQDTTGESFLYITDGVQSDFTGDNQSPSAQALDTWIQSGKSLTILAFTSEFNGRGWSESRKQWLGITHVQRRPFYLYVFAPNESATAQILGSLSDTVTKSALRIGFTTEGLRCSARVPKISGIKSSSDGLHWIMLTESATKKASSQDVAVAEYSCQIPTSFPLQSVNALVEALEYFRWDGSAMQPSARPAGSAFNADSVMTDASGSTAVVLARLMPEAARFGFYKAELRPQSGRMKSRIAQLSTDSDSNPRTYEQTYRFAWLVERLARAQVARALPVAPFGFTTFNH